MGVEILPSENPPTHSPLFGDPAVYFAERLSRGKAIEGLGTRGRPFARESSSIPRCGPNLLFGALCRKIRCSSGRLGFWNPSSVKRGNYKRGKENLVSIPIPRIHLPSFTQNAPIIQSGKSGTIRTLRYLVFAFDRRLLPTCSLG